MKMSHSVTAILFAFGLLITIGSENALALSAKSCRKDFKAHCEGMKFKKKNVLTCLAEKKDELSKKCSRYMDKYNMATNPRKAANDKAEKAKGDMTSKTEKQKEEMTNKANNKVKGAKAKAKGMMGKWGQ